MPKTTGHIPSSRYQQALRAPGFYSGRPANSVEKPLHFSDLSFLMHDVGQVGKECALDYVFEAAVAPADAPSLMELG